MRLVLIVLDKCGEIALPIKAESKDAASAELKRLVQRALREKTGDFMYYCNHKLEVKWLTVDDGKNPPKYNPLKVSFLTLDEWYTMQYDEGSFE